MFKVHGIDYVFFNWKNFFSLRERKRERAQAGERGRGREREYQAGSVLSSILQPWDHDLSQNQELNGRSINWATQVPNDVYFYNIFYHFKCPWHLRISLYNIDTTYLFNFIIFIRAFFIPSNWLLALFFLSHFWMSPQVH